MWVTGVRITNSDMQACQEPDDVIKNHLSVQADHETMKKQY